MTKGQIEFLVAVGAIIITVGAAGFILNDTRIAVNKPQHVVVQVPAGTVPVIPAGTTVPSGPVVSPSIVSIPVENCDVLKSIHIAMTKAEVINICGNPERIDDSSPDVKRVERVFKHDEIWYYDKQSETVELTNDIVTAIHPTIPQALPVIRQ